MYTRTTIPESTKLRSYSPSAALLKFLTFPKLLKKKPDQFATALAHEVRNPLSTINLAAEMLQSTIKDEDQRMYLNIIIRGSDRIKDLVTDFLTSSENKETLWEKHSIHQLLDEVLDMNKDRLLLKNIRVEKEYDMKSC